VALVPLLQHCPGVVIKYQHHQVQPDSTLLTEFFMAYYDLLAEFLQTFPRRLKDIALMNVDDVASGVTEMEHCAKMGLGGGVRDSVGAELRVCRRFAVTEAARWGPPLQTTYTPLA
jgi:hypothetical protein